MSANLPLDANDEDIQQRGLRRPSALDEALPVANAYQALQSAYDNSTIGAVSRDNIWPVREVEELRAMTAAQRRDYLTARGVIPDLSSIPNDINLPQVDNIVDNYLNEGTGNFSEKLSNLSQNLDAAIANGTNVSLDSYGQSLTGNTVQPTPLTTAPPGGSYTPVGQQPSVTGNSPYSYELTEMYDDRYDVLSGKKLYKGIASGTGGGSGAEANNTAGASGLSAQQSEIAPVPPNVSQNDTTTEQYDDAILRQARQEDTTGTSRDAVDAGDPRRGQYSSPTVNNATTAEIGRQPDQTVDTTAGADSYDTSSWTPPASAIRRTETSPPAERASRAAIRDSRRESTRDIRDARRRGENLVRLRNPDGTYYASRPRNHDSKALPQRAQ
jgi:hypothetical protein